MFSDKQKSIIKAFSTGKPLFVLKRLQNHDPHMTQSYKQVKHAVDNEKRKAKGKGKGKAAAIPEEEVREEQGREDEAEQERTFTSGD